MHKQTSFVITAVILLTAVVSMALYTVKAANAQGNMSTAGKAMVAGKSNMTSGNVTGAAKNMTGNMSTAGKAMVAGKALNKTG
jgi:hypothetical protein